MGQENKHNQINIKHLSSAEMSKFLKSFDMVITDMEDILLTADGVSAYGFLLANGLKEMNKEYRFLVRNSQKSHTELMNEFQNLGLDHVKHGHILTPAKILLHYLQQTHDGRPIYSICNPNVNDYLVRNGIKVIKPESKLDINKANVEKRLKTYCKVDAVTVDYNCNTSWNNYALANRYLKKNPEAQLICIQDEILTRLDNEMCSVGGVSLMNVIGHNAPNCKVHLFKPCVFIGHDMIRYFNILMPSRVLFIGTSIDKDIKMGNALNFQTMLLKTPSLKWTHYLALPKCSRPDYFAESITDLLCCFDIDYHNSFFQ